jgi:hypothetical protein
MLFMEIIAVCCEKHTKQINTPCGQNAELFNVKAGGTFKYRYALRLKSDNRFILVHDL